MVRHFRNQKYAKLKRDHQQRGELFTDPEFPPDSKSLFLSGKNEHDIVWKRPRVWMGGRKGEEGRRGKGDWKGGMGLGR